MFMFVLMLALAACSEPAPSVALPNHAGHVEEGLPREAAAIEPGPASNVLRLSLNDGARWPMDDHTRQVMEETRATLAGATVASVEDTRALGHTLQEQLDRLVRGCTMSGAAHDALHSFLVVYIPAVASLKDAQDLDSGVAQVTAIKAMVDEYARFFE